MTVQHNVLDGANAHSPFFRLYNNASERMSDTTLTSSDRLKVAFQKDDSTVWVLINEGTPIWVQIGEQPVFGQNYLYQEEVAVQSTSSTSYVNAITVNFSISEDCRMRLSGQFQWKCSSTSYDVRVQWRLDGTELFSMAEETKDKNSWHHESGFASVDLLAGNHTLEIDYSIENSGQTAYIRNVAVDMWRVA